MLSIVGLGVKVDVKLDSVLTKGSTILTSLFLHIARGLLVH